jgi:hypothetical protein
MTLICQECGSDHRVDTYNDFDDQPGVLICDACIYTAAKTTCAGSAPYTPERPEGYYHYRIGTFD